MAEFVLFIVACIGWTDGATPAVTQPPAEWKSLEDEVVRHRAMIKSGHVRLAWQYSDLRRKFNDHHVQEVFFDGGHLRGDVYAATDAAPPPVRDRFRRTSCFGCWENRAHVSYRIPTTPRNDSAIGISEHDEAADLYTVPDPRWFGLLPFNLGMQSNFTSRSFVGSKHRTDFGQSEEVLSSRRCFRLYWRQMDPGLEVRMWVAPEFGYNILRMESEFDSNGQIVLDRVDLQVEPFANGTLFFPTELHYTRHEGDALVEREDVSIHVVSLNEPLASDTFSIAGIAGIPSPNPVTWNLTSPKPGPDPLVWDGKQVAAKSPEMKEGPPVAKSWRMRLIVVNIMMVSALVVVWLCFFRPRRDI